MGDQNQVPTSDPVELMERLDAGRKMLTIDASAKTGTHFFNALAVLAVQRAQNVIIYQRQGWQDVAEGNCRAVCSSKRMLEI